jgi:hypothetical protein
MGNVIGRDKKRKKERQTEKSRNQKRERGIEIKV